MDFLFSNPYVVWVLVLVALFFLYQRLAPRLTIRAPALNANPTQIIDKLLGASWAERKLQKAIEREKKRGNYLGAGKLLEDAGRPALAADLYIEGQEFWAAASTLEKLGRVDKAAELFLQAGDHKKAAQMLASMCWRFASAKAMHHCIDHM